MNEGITIGELAKTLNLNTKTIRYYEEVGLLPEPRRSQSGYRLYTGYEAERLRLVKKAKLLGLSLAEIKELVEYAIDGRCNTLEQRLLSLVKEKLEEIDRKMLELVSFREELALYKKDLSDRLASMRNKAITSSKQSSCTCIDENAPSSGPGEGIVGERRNNMADKVKKEPKSTTPQSKCGCGCDTVKK